MTNAGLSGLFLHQPSPSAFELVRLYPDGEGCIAAVSGSKNRKKTLDGALRWFGRDRGLPEPARQLFRYDSDSDSGRLDFWTRTFFDLPFHAIGRLDDAGRLVLDWEHRGVRIRSGVVYEPLEDAHAEASPAIAERPTPVEVDPGPPLADLPALALEIFRGDPFHQPVPLDARTFVHFWALSSHYHLRQTRERALLAWNLRHRPAQGSDGRTLPPIEEGLGADCVAALIAMFSSITDAQLASLTPERPVLCLPYEGLSPWWSFDALAVLHPAAARMNQVKDDHLLPLFTYLVLPCHACEFGSPMNLAQALAQQVDIAWSDPSRAPHPALSMVGYAPPKRPRKKLAERKPYNARKTPIGPRLAGKWWELENAWGRILRLAELDLVELDPATAQPIGSARTGTDWDDLARMVADFLEHDRF